MKNKLNSILLVLFLLLSSCGNEDKNKRVIFLSAKYTLSSAAFNEDYMPTAAPAYFNQIPNCINCKGLFDLKNSYIIYNVKMVDGKPIGYGEFNISFNDKTINDKTCDYFEYEVDYDYIYGGIIRFNKPYSFDYIGQQSCRNHYAWTRMACSFPEVEEGRRIILEFYVTESFEEPSDFDYTINL